MSYSTYLSHMIVITVMQYTLLTWLPQLSLTGHIAALLSLTLTVTVAIPAALYRYAEVPGIAWGRSVARSITSRRTDCNMLPGRGKAVGSPSGN
jgi:peptidoglycan/LPS O-acetylase OafA/YrhL